MKNKHSPVISFWEENGNVILNLDGSRGLTVKPDDNQAVEALVWTIEALLKETIAQARLP